MQTAYDLRSCRPGSGGALASGRDVRSITSRKRGIHGEPKKRVTVAPGGVFDLMFLRDSEEKILKKLQHLLEEETSVELEFRSHLVHATSLTPAIESAVVQVLQHYYKVLERRWKKITWRIIPDINRFTSVFADCSMDIFLEIELEGSFMRQIHLSLEIMCQISDILRRGNIEVLKLRWLPLSFEATWELSTGLAHRNTRLQHLVLHSVRFHCDDNDDSIDCLGHGFAQNQSLRSIELCSNGLSDTRQGKLISTLDKHPSLEKLWLYQNGHDVETFRGVGQVLQFPNTRLTHLMISDPQTYSVGSDCMEILAVALQQNTSLRVLHLGFNKLTDEDLQPVWPALLKDTPNLEVLDLSYNSISHLPDIRTWVKQNNLTNLRLLDLVQNPILMTTYDVDVKEEQLKLQAMLSWHSRLGRLTDSSLYAMDLELSNLYTPAIENMLDYNSSGRQLFLAGDPSSTDTSPIEKGLWPIVLEATNQLFETNSRRRANAIYQVVKGMCGQKILAETGSNGVNPEDDGAE